MDVFRRDHVAVGDSFIRTPDAAITEAELVAWGRENFASYKRIVEFRDSLPMTSTGKILKRERR